MIRTKRAFHDPDVTDFAKTRGTYTTSFVECDEQIKRWLTAHGVVGAEVILVCARLPDRFVALTNTSVWWMEDGELLRFPVEPGYPLGAFWNIIRLLSP